MIIFHPNVPEIRNDWLPDENEVIVIFLARGFYLSRFSIVDERQIVILCRSNMSGTREIGLVVS